MANWKYKIDMAADWKLAKDRAIDAAELSRRMIVQLQGLPCSENTELQDIIEEFKELAENSAADFDNFDEVYDRLCDWGDQEVAPYGQWSANKMCWIGVF